MRINRTNPEQPAAQPVQGDAPLKAQTEANGFELPEQEIPKENQKEPPKAAKPPKPKKEKPAKKPRRQPVEEVEDDEENEQPRRRFPFGCLIVLVILALVGFGGYKVSQFYAELDGQARWARPRPSPCPRARPSPALRTQLKDAGVIEYDWLFKQYVKYSGKAGEIQYGDFEVQSGMAYNDIIKALSVVTRRATVQRSRFPRARQPSVWRRFSWTRALWTTWTPSCPAPTAATARIGASTISGTPSPTMTA